MSMLKYFGSASTKDTFNYDINFSGVWPEGAPVYYSDALGGAGGYNVAVAIEDSDNNVFSIASAGRVGPNINGSSAGYGTGVACKKIAADGSIGAHNDTNWQQMYMNLSGRYFDYGSFSSAIVYSFVPEGACLDETNDILYVSVYADSYSSATGAGTNQQFSAGFLQLNSADGSVLGSKFFQTNSTQQCIVGNIDIILDESQNLFYGTSFYQPITSYPNGFNNTNAIFKYNAGLSLSYGIDFSLSTTSVPFVDGAMSKFAYTNDNIFTFIVTQNQAQVANTTICLMKLDNTLAILDSKSYSIPSNYSNRYATNIKNSNCIACPDGNFIGFISLNDDSKPSNQKQQMLFFKFDSNLTILRQRIMYAPAKNFTLNQQTGGLLFDINNNFYITFNTPYGGISRLDQNLNLQASRAATLQYTGGTQNTNISYANPGKYSNSLFTDIRTYFVSMTTDFNSVNVYKGLSDLKVGFSFPIVNVTMIDVSIMTSSSVVTLNRATNTLLKPAWFERIQSIPGPGQSGTANTTPKIGIINPDKPYTVYTT